MTGDWPECPHCPGEELINDPGRPGWYECGYCNRKYPVSDFDKPPAVIASPDLSLRAKRGNLRDCFGGLAMTARRLAPRDDSADVQAEKNKENTMALAKDDPNKTKLWQLNFRRKAKGLAPFASLEDAIKEGSYVPCGKAAGARPGKDGKGGRSNAAVEERPSPVRLLRARRSGAGAAPAPPGNNGHGAERDLSMLGGVIIQELQKERAALDLAISVIERRFRGVTQEA